MSKTKQRVPGTYTGGVAAMPPHIRAALETLEEHSTLGERAEAARQAEFERQVAAVEPKLEAKLRRVLGIAGEIEISRVSDSTLYERYAVGAVIDGLTFILPYDKEGNDYLGLVYAWCAEPGCDIPGWTRVESLAALGKKVAQDDLTYDLEKYGLEQWLCGHHREAKKAREGGSGDDDD